MVNHISTKLSAAEQRYHIDENECLALVWAVKRYRGRGVYGKNGCECVNLTTEV